jgi:Cu(I)/Ag(I) efflux system membrane fusion protein
MYANGIINAKMSDMKDAKIIPKSAVLWTGKRAVVYVKVPHEKTISFVYREINLGQDMGEFYIVEDGLEAGEVIATNGVFRIDASAQLVGKKSMMNPDGGKVNLGHAGMDMGGDSNVDMKDDASIDHSKMDMSDPKIKSETEPSKMENDTKHTDMNQRITTTDAFKGQLEEVFNAYIKLKDALTSDDSKLASASAKTLLNVMKKVDMKQLTNNDAHNHWMTISKEILASATSISEISDIDKQRSHFKHLSAHLSKGVKLFGVNQKVYEQFCPMADNNNGAVWLSLNEEIKNPYMGSKMPTCGTTETTIVK